MDPEILHDGNPDAGADGSNVAAPDGTARDEAVAAFHEVVNEQLGTSYKSDQDALKGLKELQSLPGKYGKYETMAKKLEPVLGGESAVLKKMEELATPTPQPEPQPQPVEPQSTNEIASIRERLFYAENPEYKPYRDLIQTFGTDPERVVTSDGFKTAFEKIKAYDESQSSRSVLQTSPRLGEVTDKIGEAQEAMKIGAVDEARAKVADAVLSAYNLK